MKSKRIEITGLIVIIILGLFAVCSIATAHIVSSTEHLHPHKEWHPCQKDPGWCDQADGHKSLCGKWADGPVVTHPAIENGVIQTDNPAGIDTKTDTEDWVWELDDYDPLHQKVAQLEREIQLLGVQLGSVREELFWLRSINRQLIQEIYKRNHL